MRRLCVAMITLTAVVFTLSASPTRLVFMGRDGPYEEAMRLAIALYAVIRPDVHVEYLGLPWAGLREKITIELVEGRGNIDLVVLDDPWTSEFLPAGFLEPLQPWYEATGRALPGFVKPALDLGRWPYPDGTLYALPVVGNVQLFAYRSDLFEKYGLPHPPRTWVEALTAAKLISEAEPDVFGVVFRGARGHDIVVSFLPILWAHGGDIIVDGQSGVDSPEFREALSLFIELSRYAPGDVNVYRAAGVRETLLAGKAALALEVWPAWIPELDDPRVSRVVGKVELSAHPGAVYESAPMLGIWLLGMPSTSRNKAAAFDFLTFVTDPFVQRIMTLKVGNPPTVESLYQDREIIGLYRWYPAQLEALRSGVARPRIPIWSRVEDILGTHLHEVLVGTRTMEDAVRAAHAAINRVLME